MSDFLGHLVAKNLDGTETLRPRLPSLFEPVKGGGGTLSGEPLQSEQAAELFVPELTVPDRLEDIETLESGARRPETRAPVMDDRSELRHQPPQQVAPARAGTSHLAWVQHSETQDPETRVDSNQAAPASSGADAPHGNLESALERITRPFDPTRDSPALGEQRLTRLPEPISRGSEERLAPKNAPQITLRPRISPTAERKDDEAVMPQNLGEPVRQPENAPHITLRPRTSPAAERKDDEAVTPQILGEPVRQLAPKSATKFIVVEEARPILTRQLNRSLSEQGSEATVARNSAALLDSGLRRNDDGRPTIADLIPLAAVQSDLAPAQPARVSTPAVARPQVTRHVERFTQVPDAYARGTPETKPVPTIQVTIGRIEVRATPAATQHAKKPRSAPSVMTLDEYLRNRGKGEGR